MFNFNQAFPIFNQKIQPICGRCDGRGVIPCNDKVVTCPKCKGTGKENNVSKRT